MAVVHFSIFLICAATCPKLIVNATRNAHPSKSQPKKKNLNHILRTWIPTLFLAFTSALLNFFVLDIFDILLLKKLRNPEKECEPNRARERLTKMNIFIEIPWFLCLKVKTEGKKKKRQIKSSHGYNSTDCERKNACERKKKWWSREKKKNAIFMNFLHHLVHILRWEYFSLHLTFTRGNFVSGKTFFGNLIAITAWNALLKLLCVTHLIIEKCLFKFTGFLHRINASSILAAQPKNRKLNPTFDSWSLNRNQSEAEK